MVESLSKEMQNAPRVLQEKEPGGEERDGAAQKPSGPATPLVSSSALSALLTSLLRHYRRRPQGGQARGQACRSQAHR